MKKLILISCLVVGFHLVAQEKTMADKMIDEIQQTKQTNTSIKIVWWIPTEYWQTAIQQQENVSAVNMKRLIDLFNPYTIIVAGDFSLYPNEVDFDFKVNDVTKSLTFYDLNGIKQLPLKKTEVDEMVNQLMDQMLKPLFKQMLGKMGGGVEIFVYNNLNNSKERIINPTEKGQFQVNVSTEIFRFNLPLVSLMKEKTCSFDNEKLPGNFVYCPIHGNKL